MESRAGNGMRREFATVKVCSWEQSGTFLSFLFLFYSFGDGPRNEKWEPVMVGSTYGGRGFGPCSYLSGGLEIN